MPFYEYDCPEHGWFVVMQPMFLSHKADCGICGKPAERRYSVPGMRVAEPITLLQELPGGRGYQVLNWKADSGISPKQGQPYKTAKEVEKERYGGIKEV